MKTSIFTLAKLLLSYLYLFIFCSCVSYQYSYVEKDKPLFSENYLPEDRANSENTDTIKVVSFNIEFSLKVKKAIDLIFNSTLRDADIFLLQEMDETGAAKIAEELQMSYIYYPSIYHPKHKKNVGNAILTSYPITKSNKLILPHPSSYPKISKWKNYKFNKIASQAIIEVQGKKISLYSIHTAAFNTTQNKLECSQEIVDHAQENQSEYTLVGGDFNSMGQADISASIGPFLEDNYIWSSKSVGYSGNHKRALLSFIPLEAFVLDHILSKGFDVISRGKISAEGVSDHDAIWVRLVIRRN